MANSIDRQTAADLLDNLIGMFDDSNGNDYDAALKLGIEALRADVPDTNVGDTISRQAAIDGIHDAWMNGAYYTETINTLKRLPSAQRWIPCSEELPENGRTVLVTDWGETDFGRSYDGRWWNCDGDVLKDVSAWMPLPEPYKDSKKNG